MRLAHDVEGSLLYSEFILFNLSHPTCPHGNIENDTWPQFSALWPSRVTYKMNHQIAQTRIQRNLEGLNYIRESRLQSPGSYQGQRRIVDNDGRSVQQDVTRTPDVCPPEDGTWCHGTRYTWQHGRTERRNRCVHHRSQRAQHSRPGSAARGGRSARTRDAEHDHEPA